MRSDYRWAGPQHYLALHDIKLADGETVLEGAAPYRLLDLRERMTFVPKGAAISGWSRPERSSNGFTALYFDPLLVAEETERRSTVNQGRPLLYFDDSALRSTLGKISMLLKEPASAGDLLYAETLALLATLELDRLQQRGSTSHVPDSGRLSFAQEKLLRDYIEEHLAANTSLSELADLVRLSRFHFARSFKRTVGLPPHQFVLHRRVERAKTMLLTGDMPISKIAESLGFGNQGQLSVAFRKMTGLTPSQFRQLHR